MPSPHYVTTDGKVHELSSTQMRNLAIKQPKPLVAKKWVVAYAGKNYDDADRIYGNFKSHLEELGIKVEEPDYIELEYENSYASFESQLE